MKKENRIRPKWILAEHLDGLEKSDLLHFEIPREHICPKGNVESTGQNKEEGQPK